jgi:3-deoxy-D-manno-octulosonic-acid transferase
MKFDVQPPPDALDRARLLREFFPNRFVVLAASTRDGEEPLILAAFSKLAVPGLLLLIVPRHPQRFDAVAELLRRRGIDFLRRSDRRPVPPETQVLLGDSMGEMAAYYAACDVAFIGGSLLPLGGQNLREAAAAGRPILIGPHTWNFREVSEQAIAAGAALRVQSAEELAVQVRSLFDRPEMRVGMGEAGRAFAEKHRGATARVMAMLASALPGPGG